MIELVDNKYGFKEVKNKPTPEELKQYYSKKYYKVENKTNKYQKEYSEDEKAYIFNRLNRKIILLNDLMEKTFDDIDFLDVGCGEGWSLYFLKDKCESVTGLEYNADAAKHFHPKVAQMIIEGDVIQNIDSLIQNESSFDVIILDNVLEHVIDPEEYVLKLKKLLNKGGVMVVEVPNDFSDLQLYLKENGMIDEPFWVITPDHLSYFNYEGLKNLFIKNGWQLGHLTCDYPIDQNLLNENTNYVKDSSKGRAVHLSRVKWENFLDNQSVDITNKLYELYASMGLGRNLIGYFIKK